MNAAGRDASLEPAFVLHTRAYSNSSLIVEVLAREHGRIALVARGVRAQRSRTAGLLQPFQPLAMSWRLRGEMGTLQQVEAAGQPLRLQGRRLVSGLYSNELLIRLLGREDPHPGLFEGYVQLIESLAAEAPEAQALRTFERDLLGLLGYGLALATDTQGDPLVPAQWYRYDPHQGAIPVAGPQAGGVVVQGQALLDLARNPISMATARATRALMRSALNPHLGGRPLKSRELYARYSPQGESSNGASSGQS